MRHAIELNNLLTYSSIYNLGLTDEDFTHLSAIYSLYNGKGNAEYIYKPTSKNFDLTMIFHGYVIEEPIIYLRETDSVAVQHGYPLLSIRNQIYFKSLPKPELIHYLDILREALNLHDNEKVVYGITEEYRQAVLATNLRGILDKNVDYEGKLIKACFWVVNKLDEYDEDNYNLDNLQEEFKKIPHYVKKIISVLQLPNDMRIACVAGKRGWGDYNNYHVGLSFYTTNPGDPCYNFTDKGNYCSYIDNDTGQPKIIYTDQKITFTKDEEALHTYCKGKNFLTLDAPTVDMLTKRWMRKQQDINIEREAIQKLDKKIKSKILTLDQGETFQYNDVTFLKHSFMYENQELSNIHVPMSDVLKYFAGRYSEDNFNFESILNGWLELIFYSVLKTKTTMGKIGDVDYIIDVTDIQLKSKTTGRITHASAFRINGCRINKDEVRPILARAICFKNTKEFTEFCKSVATCSLRYHRILASGLNLTVYDEIFDETLRFKLNIIREKGKNYISIDNNRWKIHDTNRLLTLLNAGSMSRVIITLLCPDIVGMTGDEIREVLEKGKKSLVEQKQKEDELMQNTMQLFGIEKLNVVTCTNGKVLTGYLVHGKIRDYLVEETKCLVFEYPSGRYICMVDKNGQNEHTNTARLVNRFYALSNDSKLAKEISTL